MGKKELKRKAIIISGFVVLLTAIIVLILFEVKNKKREEFLKKAYGVFTQANDYYKKLDANKKVKFSSTGINSLNLEDKSLKYCVNYDENGVKILDVTDGNYYVTITNEKNTAVKNVKKTNYDDFKCTNPLPVLALSGYDESIKVRSKIFNEKFEESKIEKITFVDSNKVPEKVIYSYDASLNKDSSVMAWYIDSDKNGKYELYIGGEGGVATSEDASYLFAGLYNTTSIDVSKLDTSRAKTMKGMFYYLVELRNLNVSNFDTSRVEDMSLMFYYLIRISNLDLSNFDTSNVKDMSDMFSGEWALLNLNLSNFNTSNVAYMTSMFMDSSKLEKINIKGFDFSKAKDTQNMFKNCYMLSKVELSDLNIKKDVEVKDMFCRSQVDKNSEFFKKIDKDKVDLMFNCK